MQERISKTWNWIKQNKLIVAIIVAIIVATAVIRLWHFSDWLYFSLDQARDAELARESFEHGPGNLPLLGARAAGTFLRLGPVYYYFQALSVQIFNTLDPYALAVPDLVFSLLSIPLFYYFLRLFLSVKSSLLATALYSFSFLSIQYSRFAWNTNALPFWTVLTALSIYKFSSVKEKIKRGRWLVLAALSFAVLSQLHFVALAGFGLIGLIALAVYRPRVNPRHWIYAAGAFVVFYIPMILSEIATKGANYEQFKYAIFAKTGDGLPFVFSFVEAVRELSRTFMMFLTSFGEGQEEMFAWVGFVLIFAGALLLIRKIKKDKSMRLPAAIVFVWLLVFVFLYAKTDTSLKPRFFLPLAFFPFLFFGLIADKIMENFKKYGFAFVLVITAIFVGSNANAVFMWYNYLDTGSEKALKREIFLKQSDGVTVKQMKDAVGYMVDKVEKSGNNLCYRAPAARIHGYEYFMLMRLPEERFHRIKHRMDNKDKCDFFAISRIDDRTPVDEDYADDFNLIKREGFGRVAIWDIEPKDLFMNWEEIQKEKEENKQQKEPPKKESDEAQEKEKKKKDDSSSNEESRELDRPERRERVLWKGVFE
ncbi:MAG: glycosyltransferase family 39 protein [Candidatus Moranbacteria bacterium]|nr:glycosyltransferase family 39 protein [Candidatus Moranbacteria bacterium]